MVIVGEAGIGKSHLVHALQQRLVDEPHLPVRFFCSPYHSSSALFPISSYFERAVASEVDETVGDRLDKLNELLAPSRARPEQVGLVAELLGLPALGRYRPPELTPQQRKEKIFEVVLSHVLGLSRRQPVMMLFEDVHWIDPTSLELLTAIIERAQNAPHAGAHHRPLRIRPALDAPCPRHNIIAVAVVATRGSGARRGESPAERCCQAWFSIRYLIAQTACRCS